MTTDGIENGESRAVGRDHEAWSAFWADPAQSSCSTGSASVQQALAAHWSEFARTLPRAARVLDLGCGAGAVGRRMLAARPDLHVTGIDAARVPASGWRALELRSETPMEALPFHAASFDAVVSQFGFEYSHTEETVREIARVLAPGAAISLLVHHSQSAIVNVSRERRGAVVAFLAPGLRDSFRDGNGPRLGAELALLVQRYPDDELISQLASALPGRLGGLRERRTAVWHSLEEALRPEMQMTATLERCCVPPDVVEAWTGILRKACELDPIGIVHEPDGTAVAWCLTGTRRSMTPRLGMRQADAPASKDEATRAMRE